VSQQAKQDLKLTLRILVVSRKIGLAIVLAARMVGAPGLIAGQAKSARTPHSVRSLIEHDVAHAIRGVSRKPLGANQATEYTQGGVSYRMTLAPVSRIDIEFVPRSVGNTKYKSEHTSYFVGVRGNTSYFITAETGSVQPAAVT
jgi:hypothetical protein